MLARTGTRPLLARLVEQSIRGHYNPYESFEWVDAVPEDRPWMSAELLSVHGTDVEGTLDEERLLALSKWELVNYFSFNVHGIRDLMLQVLGRIHQPGYERYSPYFHHFLGEENAHMWFFAEFCLRYAGRILPSKRVPYPPSDDALVENLLAFARIMISEQISDFYNVWMLRDEGLHPLVREINRVHHVDESRHIAMGQEIVCELAERVRAERPPPLFDTVKGYVRTYSRFFLEAFYSPDAYRLAGFPDALALRTRLLATESRGEFHERVLKRTRLSLAAAGLLEKTESFP